MSEKELIIPNGADAEIYKAQVEAGEVEPVYKEEPAKEHIDTTTKESEEPKGTKQPKEGDEPDGDDDGKQTPNRPVEHIPAWKHKEELKKARQQAVEETRAELEADFQEKLKVAGEKPGGATADDVNKIAEEFGLDASLVPAFIERLAESVSTRIKLPEEIAASVNDLKEQQRQVKEQQGFESEWGDKDTQDALKTVLNGKEVSADFKGKIKELAYTSTYHRYRIADIIRLEGSKFSPQGESKTAEAGRGGASRGAQMPSINEMTPEQVLALSDEEFLRLSNELGSKGSKFIKTGKK